MRATRQQTARRSLCPRCCRIDFNRVFHLDLIDLQANGQNGTLLERIRTTVDRNHPPECALCVYIDRVNTSFDSSSQDLQLQVFSTFGLVRGEKKTVEWKRLPGALHARDLPHLALVSIGYASNPTSNPAVNPDVLSNAEFFFCIKEHEQNRPIFQPQALAQQIDYASVAASLNFCKSKHRFLCNKGSDVVGLSRLIDCQSSVDSIFIVPAQPSTPYLALSYVWGYSSNRKTTRDVSESEKMSISGIPLSVLPRTISDAVIVVRNLGYRYLWVDKLCIDQDCAIEKHAQVSLMDQIYGGAEITIVAAAGSDSEHGLPGVSSTLRRTTQKSELEECQIVFTPRHPHHFIRNSTWASRAWTYQEALLSRRLLFFTESETYFECHSMQSRECMRYDFETLHCKQGKLYAYFNSPLFLKGISTFDSYIRASVPSLIRSYECIVEYTNRNMTYETDSLTAFIGIIKRLEKCKIPVFHLQGIPFLSEDCMDGTYKSLIAGLLWKHTKSPREASPPRRDSLPSWSWAGWEGKIRFFTNTREVYTHFIPKATLAGLELRNGTTLNLDAIPRNAMDIANLQVSAIRLEAQFLAEESFFIRIAGYAPAARVVSKLKTPIRRPKSNLSQKPKQVQPSRKGRKPVPTISYDGFVSRLYVYEKPKSLNRFAEFFSASQFKALLVGHLPPFYPRGGDGTLCFLIVKPYKDGFSRVGILEVLHNFDAFIGDIQLKTGLFLIY